MSQTHNRHSGGYLRNQRQFFDELITRDWNEYCNPEWDATRRREVEELFNITGNGVRTVLDIGCGCGFHDVTIAERDHITSVVGLDYSTESIKKADQHYPHKKVQRSAIDIFDSSAMAPYNGQFDLVASFQVIEHLENPEAFFRLNQRCVKPGGFVCVVTPNWNRLENRLRSLLRLKLSFCDPLHFQEYTMGQLVNMARDFDLDFRGSFGHTMVVSMKGFKLLNWTGSIPFHGFSKLNSLANIIGVVFQWNPR
jgi:2-polyprenyl-3-methyl-5-hydroxy-6-metoxy-1,4-benzoquinol methylase